MDTAEVAEKYGLTRAAVINWCRKNGVKRKLSQNGIMQYELSAKDIKNFENRKTQGWVKGKSRSPKKS